MSYTVSAKYSLSKTPAMSKTTGEFMTLDTAPITDKVKVQRWGLATREIILAVVASCLFILCLIFLGLYINSDSDSPSVQDLCTTRTCMRTAAHIVGLMNKSADPCDNFYQYACGNYKTYNPITGTNTRSILEDLGHENLARIQNIISRDPDSTYEPLKSDLERKLSNFFHSCMDFHQRESLGGRPFLEKVIPSLGGWELLGTWDKRTWDFTQTLKTVQADLAVNAFYRVGLKFSADCTNRYFKLRPPPSQYMLRERFGFMTSVMRRKYEKFMKKIGTLLVRDANLTNVADTERLARVNRFAADALLVETRIANQFGDIQGGSIQWQRLNLTTLTAMSGNAIDWVDQVSYNFPESGVTGSTEVTMLRMDAFLNIVNITNSLPAANRKRILHNFLIWRVAEEYLRTLSFEYVNADNQIKDIRFPDPSIECERLIKTRMDDALGAVYVQENFAAESKQKVKDITTSLMKTLQKQLDKTPWMDDQTKNYAKKKLDNVTFKLGYPDWMANATLVEEMYTPFEVNKTNFFSNYISSTNFRRLRLNDMLKKGDLHQHWLYEPYDTVIRVNSATNDVTVAAGILQDPIWNHQAPRYATYGSLGANLGRFLHHFIDQQGNEFDMNGARMHGTWWSNSTTNKYKRVTECVSNQLKKTSGTGASKAFWGDTRQVISVTSGIRLALKGYQDWMGTNNNREAEKGLPGTGMSPKQAFFVTYAQSQCQNIDENLQQKSYQDPPIPVTQLNTALGQLQEFSEAFQCPTKSNMNHETKCTYY